MTAISYFQRYSQRENHATNNTLLMLRHVYALGPDRLERLMANWLGGSEILIGPNFRQQIRGPGSIPDAGIQQSAFSLWIETKLGDDLGEAQIDAHLEHVSKLGPSLQTRYLIGLTRRTLRNDIALELADRAKIKSVTFLSASFAELLRALEDECRPHETALQEIIADYADYLLSEDLLPNEDKWMAIFPCRASIRENVQFGLYYEPAGRPFKRSTFIGIYADKAVRYVGRVSTVLICEIDGDGGLRVVRREAGDSETSEMINRVRGAIDASVHDLRQSPHRFYLTDAMSETMIQKTDAGGIMGLRYLNLERLADGLHLASATSATLAEAVMGQAFADGSE